MFHRRSLGPSGLLEWRVRLFGIGAILGLVGIWADLSWLVWAGIAALTLGFLLRFGEVEDEVEDVEAEPDGEGDSPAGGGHGRRD